MAATLADNRFVASMCDTVVGLVRRDGPDLTARQLSVLLIVALEDDEHTIRGLAERLNVVKPAISYAVNRLVEFDLVCREPDLRDGRSVLVARTASGGLYMAYVRSLLTGAAKAHGIDLQTSITRAAT
jgi:DNA-binding MarR family transcriptional regulator